MEDMEIIMKQTNETVLQSVNDQINETNSTIKAINEGKGNSLRWMKDSPDKKHKNKQIGRP